MKSQKGVSALIASVLLIAFTVSVAMIVMGWFSSFVRTTTENVSGVTQGAIGCSSGIIQIDKVYLHNGTGYGYVNITVKNTGQISLVVNGMVVNTSGTSCTSTGGGVTIAAGASGVLGITNCPNWTSLGTPSFSSALLTTSCAGITDSTSNIANVVFLGT